MYQRIFFILKINFLLRVLLDADLNLSAGVLSPVSSNNVFPLNSQGPF